MPTTEPRWLLAIAAAAALLPGDRRDLLPLCRRLLPAGQVADPDPAEAARFQASVASILKADPSAPEAVRTLLHAEPAAVRYYLVEALGDAGTPAALEVLVSQVRAQPGEELFVLVACARAGAQVELPVDEAIPSSIGLHLASSDPNVVRAAAQALAALQDADSAPWLVDLLRHEDPEVARAAHEALRAVTGCNLLADAGRWRAWLQGESDWRARRMDALVSDLRGSDALRKMAAIEEMVRHPLHRREIAERLAEALPHENRALLRAGCAALGQLGAATAVPFLKELAAGPDPEVAAEAGTALQRIRDCRNPPPQAPSEPDR